MANIPVERQSGGTPWWVWLLLPLALIALIWAAVSLLGGDDDDIDPALVDNQEVVDNEPAPDVAAVTGIATRVGESVTLTDVSVERVIGDRTFTVAAPDGALEVPHVIVLDEEEPSPETPGIEGQVDINPGQTVTIEGVIEELDAGPAQALDISQEEAEAVSASRYIIRATSVDITDAELTPVEVN